MTTFGATIPFVDHCGIEAIGVVAGRTRLRMALQPHHGNNIGIPHGGAICTLLDVAMGTAARLQVGRPAMTLDMQTAFLAPGRGVLTAEGWVLKAGRSILFCEAEIRDEAGMLIAKSSGTFKPVRGERRMTNLAGKVAIITGAGSGIGRAAVELFCAAGAAVLAVDRDEAGLAGTIAGIGPGGRALAMAADAGREEDVAACVARAVREFGRLDVVFANAGISGGLVPLLESTVEQWQEVLRINLIGPFLAIKHVAPILVANGGGAIVCTASVAGLKANAAGTPYSASKAGVISLVQTAANALAGTGVRVNAICPGLIETGMTRPIFDGARAKGSEARVGQLNPQRRAGAPREVAAAALFLASDAASYINGQALPVDGGLSSTLPFAGRGHG